MNKKTLFLGGVLIVLIILAYAYQGPLKKWQNNLGKPKNILAKINVDLVDKIEVTNQGGTVSLIKENQSWKYNNSKDFFADASVMTNVFNELKLAIGSEAELVSNNKERKSEFKTDASGLDVKIYQADKEVLDFIIGGMASDYVNSYISLPESAATYAVKADLTNVFSPVDWRDFTIFSTPKEKISKIRFQYPNREFTVELKDGKWGGTLPDKFSVTQEKIQPILDVMTNLEATEIPAQVFDDTGLDKHLIIIEATGDGVDNILMVGQASNDLYYAKKGDSDNIYLISKVERDSLDKSSWQLR